MIEIKDCDDITVEMFEEAEQNTLNDIQGNKKITNTKEYGDYVRDLIKAVDKKRIEIDCEEEKTHGKRGAFCEGKTKKGVTVHYTKRNNNHITNPVLSKEEALKDYNELNEITLEE